MRRRKLLPRKASLRPKTPMRKVNTARKAKEWQRAYGSPERCDFVNWYGCVVCGYTPCENAHLENDGMGRKANYDLIVPLCPTHHREQEGRTQAFQRDHDIDLYALAAQVEREWQSYTRRTPHDE